MVLGPGCKQDEAEDKTHDGEASAEAFSSDAVAKDLGWIPGEVASVTWFGPGREIMASWLHSIGFDDEGCVSVFRSIDRSYAVDMLDGHQVRLFGGPIQREKVEACAKMGMDKGLFKMHAQEEALRFESGAQGGDVEARWLKEQSLVLAGGVGSVEAFAAAMSKPDSKLGGDDHFVALLEHFDGETGVWSLYMPEPAGNRWGLDHSGAVMTNGGSKPRVEGRVLFDDAAKRDAGLEILEGLYAKANAKFGRQLRGLLEKGDSPAPLIRFNLQFSDADTMDEVLRSLQP
jgi:hypothetical protein